MRDVDVLRHRLFLALTSVGVSTAGLTGCDSNTEATEDRAAAEGEAGHEDAAGHEGEAGDEGKAHRGEGEGEAHRGHTIDEGAEPPGEMAIDPGAQPKLAAKSGEGESGEGESGEGESGEGEGDEFNYYAVPTDPYAVASEGEAGDCPQGDWCGPADKATMFEAQGADRVMGCPYKIAANNATMKRIDTDDDVWDGLSLDKRMQGRLSSQHTKKERERTGGDDLCCYHWYDYCAGRPLLDVDGEARVAATRPDGSAAWHLEADGLAARGADGVAHSRDLHHGLLADTPAELPLDATLRDRIAADWLEDAQMEHASVAAFARTTLELLALSAPASLVAEASRAAAEEVDHARHCFSLHARYGGAARGPGPLAPLAARPARFDRLVVDTFHEGCVGETVAALVATRSLRGCEDPNARRALARIADDETEHAALAWKTLAWALAQAPHGAVDELLVAARTRHRQIQSRPLPDRDPHADTLARHGRASARSKAEATRDAWGRIVLPTLEALVAASV